MANMDDGRIFNPDTSSELSEWGIDDVTTIGFHEFAYDYQPILSGFPARWNFTARTSHKRAVEIRWLDADKRIVWPRVLMDVEGDKWTYYVMQAIAPEGTCWMQGVILEADPDARTGLTGSALLMRESMEPRTPGDIAGHKQTEPDDWTINTKAAHEPVVVAFKSSGETFRGAIVGADGLTWWERKIRNLEAKGKS